MVTEIASERRADKRLTVSIPLKISNEQGDIVTETGNISRSGILCRVNQYIEPMTKLKAQLLVPVTKAGKKDIKKIVCEGVVVRVEPDSDEDFYRLALFFSDIKPRDVDSIGDYVSARLDQSPCDQHS